MKIPRKLSDILLSTYMEYSEYVKNLTDIQKEDEEQILRNTIKIFYKISEDEFNELSYSLVTDMFTIVNNILQFKQELIRTFTLDGVEYGINPNFNDITFGEMIDLNTDDIIRQLCILYRPIKEKKNGKYLIEKYNADISHYETFKNKLTLDVWIGFSSFFLKISEDLMNYTLKSLQEEALDQEKTKHLAKSGVGTASLLN